MRFVQSQRPHHTIILFYDFGTVVGCIFAYSPEGNVSLGIPGVKVVVGGGGVSGKFDVSLVSRKSNHYEVYLCLYLSFSLSLCTSGKFRGKGENMKF